MIASSTVHWSTSWIELPWIRTSSTSRLKRRAAAGLAGHEDVGEEDHLDLDVPRALAGLAAPAGRLKEKVAAVYFRSRASGCWREQLADLVERLDVGDRIGAGRAADRRLVDQQRRRCRNSHPVERAHLADRLAEVRSWRSVRRAAGASSCR